jgi:hypothetical protein
LAAAASPSERAEAASRPDEEPAQSALLGGGPI